MRKLEKSQTLGADASTRAYVGDATVGASAGRGEPPGDWPARAGAGLRGRAGAAKAECGYSNS